jgi:hypothetical protein
MQLPIIIKMNRQAGFNHFGALRDETKTTFGPLSTMMP